MATVADRLPADTAARTTAEPWEAAVEVAPDRRSESVNFCQSSVAGNRPYKSLPVEPQSGFCCTMPIVVVRMEVLARGRNRFMS
jgi:hypothetical protein